MNNKEKTKLGKFLRKKLFNIEYMQWQNYLKKHGIVKKFMLKKLFKKYVKVDIAHTPEDLIYNEVYYFTCYSLHVIFYISSSYQELVIMRNH